MMMMKEKYKLTMCCGGRLRRKEDWLEVGMECRVFWGMDEEEK